MLSKIVLIFLHDRRAQGRETPAGGAVIGQLKHVTPPKRWESKGTSVLQSVYHANARQFAELSSSLIKAMSCCSTTTYMTTCFSHNFQPFSLDLHHHLYTCAMDRGCFLIPVHST